MPWFHDYYFYWLPHYSDILLILAGFIISIIIDIIHYFSLHTAMPHSRRFRCDIDIAMPMLRWFRAWWRFLFFYSHYAFQIILRRQCHYFIIIMIPHYAIIIHDVLLMPLLFLSIYFIVPHINTIIHIIHYYYRLFSLLWLQPDDHFIIDYAYYFCHFIIN